MQEQIIDERRESNDSKCRSQWKQDIGRYVEDAEMINLSVRNAIQHDVVVLKVGEEEGQGDAQYQIFR